MKRRRKLPRYVSAFIDRHGRERFRFRRTGYQTHYFRTYPGTSEFRAEYANCLANGALTPGASRVRPGTIDDLVGRFYQTTTFTNAGADKQRSNRGIIESFRAEFGSDQVCNFGFAHIEAILQVRAVKRREGKRWIGGPVAARNLHKQLKRLFKLAVKLGWIERNPAELAEGVKAPRTGGYYAWTEEDIAQFQQRHPLGTKARLAQEILLWTWQRRGDARLFGPKHLIAGKIKYRQAKTGKDIWLPAAPQLLAAIKAMPSIGIDTFVVTEFGKSFSKAGFGNWFRDRCDEAGLPQCTAHGLRKAAARRAAEVGATQSGLKAVGGWSGDAEVAIYTATAEQEKLAAETLGRVISWDLDRSKKQ
jgi:integrase